MYQEIFMKNELTFNFCANFTQKLLFSISLNSNNRLKFGKNKKLILSKGFKKE